MLTLLAGLGLREDRFARSLVYVGRRVGVIGVIPLSLEEGDDGAHRDSWLVRYAPWQTGGWRLKRLPGYVVSSLYVSFYSELLCKRPLSFLSLGSRLPWTMLRMTGEEGVRGPGVERRE